MHDCTLTSDCLNLFYVKGDRRCPVKDVKLEHVSCAHVRKVDMIEHVENVQVLP